MKIGRLTVASVSIASMLALTACSTVGGTTGDNSASNTGSAAGDSGKTMVTVVKVKGIAWFDRMDVGVKEWGADNGYDGGWNRRCAGKADPDHPGPDRAEAGRHHRRS